MAITRIPPGPEEDGDHLQQPQPIHPPHALHGPSLSNASTATVDIEAWTVAALESLSIAPIARGTGSALSIPLDVDQPVRETRGGGGGDNGAAARMKLRGVAFDGAIDDAAYGASITRPRSARDSMRRREALLKGKEGSRQRRRWENDHLLHVPNVQPPLPSDWQIHPTHRVLPPFPYQLAQYWDNNKSFRERATSDHRRNPKTNNNKKKKLMATSTTTTGAGMPSSSSSSVGRVPRDLRATAKRTPAVKSWLRVLEEPVRQFVVERGLLAVVAAPPKYQREEEEENQGRRDGADDSDETGPDDDEEDEIVFVGRGGRSMRDGKPWKTARRQEEEEEEEELGMVLDAREDEAGGGAFKRWLTHSISDYYGLDSKSVMVGNPVRRVVYIAAKQQKQQQQQQQHGPRLKSRISRPILPPPLWEMF
ncbi:R3H-associated N-terminal domain-containing protein [Chaetomium strumarium]|uniref:R3H-associated N-terminal domain-containing protein n=1 Tax=Chaetomium strumarium TaxID=1170767 RepID=A0AAJ0GWK9_9PEZI|nr:R3H-associated N-terminal domain-containing protein [Chaetomium strumarium]